MCWAMGHPRIWSLRIPQRFSRFRTKVTPEGMLREDRGDPKFLVAWKTKKGARTSEPGDIKASLWDVRVATYARLCI